MASPQNIFSYIFVPNMDLKKLKKVLLELFKQNCQLKIFRRSVFHCYHNLTCSY